VAPSLPDWIISDPYRLRQVLLNLLSNAIKFSSNGRASGRVLVALEPCVHAGGPGLRLRVSDNGIGMTPQQLADLFTPFTQADASTARNYGGSGLGLSISRRLVELLKGQLTATSTWGEGSSFTVELPLLADPHPPQPAPVPPAAPALAPSVAPARTAPSVEQACAQGRLILIAEDNAINRAVLQAQLQLQGFASEAAIDGIGALAMWRSGRYALLLTDCYMPNMDGFELTTAIRLAEPAGTHIPIVAITANALQGEAQRCLAQGMDDYLSKPIIKADLIALLNKWLPQPPTGA
jgi:CheY-like chemotaxis protein